jgi:uncharacterized membrane protein HdeD (DUF308 family)
MTLLRGVVSILFGVLIFARPALSLVALTLVFGAYALVDGVATVVTAIGGRREKSLWWVLLLAGLTGIAVGVMTFITPGITALALLFYIAAWAIVTGVLQVIAAIRLRKEITGEFWLALSGLLSIAFGVLLIGRPGAGIFAVLWLIAAYAIAFGVMLIILAFKAKGFANRVAAWRAA